MHPTADVVPRLADQDLRLWRRIAATVTPLRPCRPAQPPDDAAEAAPPTAAAEPLPPRAPAAAAPAPSGPTRVPDLAHGVAPGLDRRSLDRLRRGRVRIEGRLDLHGATQVEAQHRLAACLADAVAVGRRCILVITGKGSRGDGVLRREVPRWLNEPGNRERVIGFCHATPADGGEGALYILLRRRRP